jgi:hypothetical protein
MVKKYLRLPIEDFRSTGCALFVKRLIGGKFKQGCAGPEVNADALPKLLALSNIMNEFATRARLYELAGG